MRGLWLLILTTLACTAPGIAHATEGATLRYGGGGQGTVVFDGALHASRGYVCNDCHLKLFITSKKALLRMEDHYTDKQCFACHNNAKATRDCGICHRKVASSPLSSYAAADAAIRTPVSPADEAQKADMLSGRLGGTLQREACLSCHGDPNLKAVTEQGAKRKLWRNPQAYAAGAHANMSCTWCHTATAGETSFAQAPHQVARPGAVNCGTCHAVRLGGAISGFMQSTHSQKLGDKMTCAGCHDPHTQPASPEKSYPRMVSEENTNCLACHTDSAKLKALSGKDIMPPRHGFLAKAERHMNSLRCVECHTSVLPSGMSAPLGGMPALQKGASLSAPAPQTLAVPTDTASSPLQAASSAVSGITAFDVAPAMLWWTVDATATQAPLVGAGQTHRILAKEDAMRNCANCHDRGGSALLARIDQQPGGKELFKDSYIPASGQNRALDSLFLTALYAVLSLVLLHALGRLLSRKSTPQGALHRELVYPAFIRVTHWINALLFLVLIITGLSIRYQGLPATTSMDTAILLHDTAGCLLILNFAVFLVQELRSKDIHQYLPQGQGLGTRLVLQARYYIFGIFTGATKPFAITAQARFNPLQQVAYLVMFILGMPILIASGLLLLLPWDYAWISRQCLAAVHAALAFTYMLFLLVHLYLATTGASPASLIKGMLNGYHEHRD